MFECKQCNKRFTIKTNLNRHERNFHGIFKKEYKCSQCEKVYKTKYALKHHFARKHVGACSAVILHSKRNNSELALSSEILSTAEKVKKQSKVASTNSKKSPSKTYFSDVDHIDNHQIAGKIDTDPEALKQSTFSMEGFENTIGTSDIKTKDQEINSANRTQNVITTQNSHNDHTEPNIQTDPATLKQGNFSLDEGFENANDTNKNGTKNQEINVVHNTENVTATQNSHNEHTKPNALDHEQSDPANHNANLNDPSNETVVFIQEEPAQEDINFTPQQKFIYIQQLARSCFEEVLSVNNDLMSEINETRVENTKMGDLVLALQNDKDIINSQLQAEKENVQNHIDQNGLLQKSIGEKEFEITKLDSSINILGKDKAILTQLLEDERKKNEGLSSLQSNEGELNELRKELEAKDKKINEYSEQLISCEKVNDNLSSTILSLSEEKNKISSKLQKKEIEMEILKKKNSQKVSEMKASQVTLQEENNRLIEEVTQLKIEKESYIHKSELEMNAEKEKTEIKMKHVRDEMLRLEKENEDLTERVTQLEIDLEFKEPSHQKEVSKDEIEESKDQFAGSNGKSPISSENRQSKRSHPNEIIPDHSREKKRK